MIKTLRTIINSLILLAALAACGGGGGASPDTPAYTKATIKISLEGTLPAGTNISGAGVTIVLPAGVTVATDGNGNVTTDTVTPTGLFATGTQVPPIYTAASGVDAATLKISLASGTVSGEDRTGEIATILVDLENGIEPTVASFGLNSLAVVDAATYNTITGLSGSVISVTLQ